MGRKTLKIFLEVVAQREREWRGMGWDGTREKRPWTDARFHAPRRTRADVVRLVSRIRKFHGTLYQLREADGSVSEEPRRKITTVERDGERERLGLDENRIDS